MFKMQKEKNIIYGKIHNVGPIISVNRSEKKPLKKRIVSVETQDQQLIFFESRNNLNRNLEIGTFVKVEYYFAGSIKGDRNYNNIIASNICTNE